LPKIEAQYCPACWIDLAYRILLPLNMGFAMTFSVVTFTFGGGALTNTAHYFLVPAARLFLHWVASVNLLARRDRADDLGREVVSIASILILAAVSALILRLMRSERIFGTASGASGGLVVLALVPAAWLYVREETWMPGGTYTFWRSSEFSVFAIEMPVVAAFFILTRNRRVAVWWCFLILVAHYALWTSGMTPWKMRLWSIKVFFLVFPLSGFAWLLSSRRREVRKPEQRAIEAPIT